LLHGDNQHATDTRAPGSERNVNVIEMLGGNAVLGNNRPVLSVRPRAAPSATTGSGSWGSTAVAVVEERCVDHRPGQTEVPRGLCHRCGTEGHRASRRGAKPASHSPTRGDPRYRLGERGTRTPVPGTVTRVSATPTVRAQDREHHDAGGHAPLSPRWRAHRTTDTPAVCPSSSRALPGCRPDRL
jgi:hypothetical protein